MLQGQIGKGQIHVVGLDFFCQIEFITGQNDGEDSCKVASFSQQRFHSPPPIALINFAIHTGPKFVDFFFKIKDNAIAVSRENHFFFVACFKRKEEEVSLRVLEHFHCHIPEVADVDNVLSPIDENSLSFEVLNT